MVRTIVITGSSSGIGEALATRYAREQARLGLIDNDGQRLEQIANQCRSLGAEVHTQVIDVRARADLKTWLEAFDQSAPIDILFANAGLITGVASGESTEPADASVELMNVNVMGVINTIHPLLPRMLERKRGSIAITSSVAGFVPLPQMPSYSASKAAILSYGLSLRAGLRTHGVKVSVICPGHVSTPMTGRIHGFKPFLRSPGYAAEKIHRGIERNKAIIGFPWYFAWFMRFGGFLPDWARQHATVAAKFSIAPKS